MFRRPFDRNDNGRRVAYRDRVGTLEYPPQYAGAQPGEGAVIFDFPINGFWYARVYPIEVAALDLPASTRIAV